MAKLPKAIPTSENTKGRLRIFRRLLLLLAASALVAAGFVTLRPGDKHGKFRTLTQIVAAQQGFEIAEKPNRPGPYEEMGVCNVGIGEPAIGDFWANGKTCRFDVPGVPGEELRVIGLLPENDGEPTYVVLRRHFASR